MARGQSGGRRAGVGPRGAGAIAAASAREGLADDEALVPYQLFRAEFQRETRRRIRLRSGEELTVGERLTGVAEDLAAKKHRHVTVGRFGPEGLDQLDQVRAEDDGSLSCRFADGARARVDATTDLVRMSCTCGPELCRHRMGALYAALASPEAASAGWGDSDVRAQAIECFDRWWLEEGSVRALLRACEASYLRLREAQGVLLDDPRLSALLRPSRLGGRSGVSLRQAMGRARRQGAPRVTGPQAQA